MFPGHHPTPRQSPRQQLRPWGCPRWRIQSIGLCSLPSSSSQLKSPAGRGCAHPLMISLFSARMKCSFSGVRMHKENFCPVRLSPSTTSVHWFMLMVPCGRVVGCKGKERGERVRREGQMGTALALNLSW